MDLAEATQRFSWWHDADLRALAGVAERIGASPVDLLLVLYAESGLVPTAVARNAQGAIVAVGLNQITPVAARAMGITEAERLSIVTQSIRDQLGYVERYFLSLPWVQAGHGLTTAAQLYQANAAPGTLPLGSAPSVVLYRKGDGAYEGNAALDADQKGTITVGDLARVLERRSRDATFQAARLRLEEAMASPPRSSSLGPVLLGSAAVAFFGFVLARGRA